MTRPGRKPTAADGQARRERAATYFSRAEYDALERHASSERVTVSELLRRAALERIARAQEIRKLIEGGEP